MTEPISISPILQSFADDVIERAQRKLGAFRTVRSGSKSYRRRAVSSGVLKESLSYSIRFSGTEIDIVFGASGNAKKYFRAVNDGRVAGKMPPTSAIKEWMKVKPIKLRSGGKFVKSTKEGIDRAAYAIAKKIQKDGIAPFPYYSEAIEEALAERGAEVRKQIEQELLIALKQWQ